MNTTRTYTTMAFSLPPEMAQRVTQSARSRQLTKSEFFREMFRSWEKQSRFDPDSDEAIMKLFAEEKEKNKKTRHQGMKIYDFLVSYGKTCNNEPKNAVS